MWKYSIRSNKIPIVLLAISNKSEHGMASVPGVAGLVVGVVTGNQVIMAHRYSSPGNPCHPNTAHSAQTDQAQRQKRKLKIIQFNVGSFLIEYNDLIIIMMPLMVSSKH